MTEIEDEVSYTCTSTSDIQNRPRGDLRHFPPSETATSHNQSESLTLSANEFEVKLNFFQYMYTSSYSVQVTCHPQQDTDKDASDGDTDDPAEMVTLEYYHSTLAYCTNEAAEAFELY